MGASKTFLILDDLETNRFLLRMMLSNLYKQCIILEAVTGTECIKMYDELISSFYILDAIFIDQNLPDMTGEEVAKELVDLNYEGPLIMISASDDESINKMRANKLLCTVIQKPLTANKFKIITDKIMECHVKNKNSCMRKA